MKLAQLIVTAATQLQQWHFFHAALLFSLYGFVQGLVIIQRQCGQRAVNDGGTDYMAKEIKVRAGALEGVVKEKEEGKGSTRFFLWHNLFRPWRA